MAEILSFDPSPSHRFRGGALRLPQGERGSKVTSPSNQIEGGEVDAQHRVRVARHGGEVHRGVSFASVPEGTASAMDRPVKPCDGVVLWGGFQLPTAIVGFNRTVHTASQIDTPVEPEDGAIKWVHHQTPVAIVRFNRTIHAAAQIDPPVKPEGERKHIYPTSLRPDRRAHESPEQAQPAQPSPASAHKPLLFIHNLKPHRKTGK